MNDLTTTTKARATQGAAGGSTPHPSEAHPTAGGEVQSEAAAIYLATKAEDQAEHEAAVLAEAEAILRKRFERLGTISNPQDSGAWLRARLATRDSESFCCIFLDHRHRVLAFAELFRGTIDGCSVPPREVLRACLQHNAGAVIFAHNHPSGVAEPSAADVAITQTLKQALDLIGVRVLDHLIVGETVASLAQRGLC